MNQIQYFKCQKGMYWGAVAPGQFEEQIYFRELNSFVVARIESRKSESVSTTFYDQIDNRYCLCSREEYLAARCKAQIATTEFFSQFQPVNTPPVKSNPTLMDGFLAQVRKPGPFVTLATGLEIINDLPF